MDRNDSSPPRDAKNPEHNKPYLVLDPRDREPREGATLALFIGTSHTEYHSMPEIAARLSARPLFCQSITHPMRSLRDHLAEPSTLATLDARPWNALVLQERTLAPFEDFDAHLRSVAAITERARAMGARVILQRHWPRARWHKDYVERSALIGETPPIMFSRLVQLTERVSSELAIDVAPVGDAWMIALGRIAAQRLYYRGGNHANLAGAILTAHVYATMLTNTASLAEGFRHEMCWDLSEHLCEWAHEALAKR